MCGGLTAVLFRYSMLPRFIYTSLTCFRLYFTICTHTSHRNMPDVLFVDEDGNPIEAGSENVVYVDENGNEIPEEIAQQLLETGKYLDSRELYQTAASVGGDTSGLGDGGGGGGNASMAIGDTFLNGGDSQEAFDGSRASFQASVINTYVKGSGYMHTDSTSTANHVLAAMPTQQQQPHQHHASGVSQSHAIALAEAQARIFAEAQIQLKRREEELAQIEADANRESSRLKELIENATQQQQQHQHQQQLYQQQQQQLEYQQQLHLQQQHLQLQLQQQQEFNKSLSNTDVEKSQSLRRIPLPPPKKHSDSSETSSSFNNNSNTNTMHTMNNNNNNTGKSLSYDQSGTSLYSVSNAHPTTTITSVGKQQVYDLAQLIGASQDASSSPLRTPQRLSTSSGQQRQEAARTYASSDDDDEYEYAEQQQRLQEQAWVMPKLRHYI